MSLVLREVICITMTERKPWYISGTELHWTSSGNWFIAILLNAAGRRETISKELLRVNKVGGKTTREGQVASGTSRLNGYVVQQSLPASAYPNHSSTLSTASTSTFAHPLIALSRSFSLFTPNINNISFNPTVLQKCRSPANNP